LPESLQIAFEKKIGCAVLEGYGLTEASPVTHCNPVSGKRRLGSIGLPLPGTDVRIMDLATGQRQMGYGPDQAGELCVKGPQVMMGYLNQPEETARALRGGWLYTGDVAYMDERGWTFIKDRSKDLIKYKGFSVFPTEVENYLYAHPDVLEAAVVGLPDPESGEKIKAFIVLRP
jgi:long-chain acyl-CoA synthetase